MPIYAYKCASCGHSADVMQKVADAPLTVCMACGNATFSKQITAAGFQLKGSGWYATDFKNGSKGAKKEATETSSGDKEKTSDTKASESKTESTPQKSDSKAETKTPSSDTKSTA